MRKPNQQAYFTILLLAIIVSVAGTSIFLFWYVPAIILFAHAVIRYNATKMVTVEEDEE